MTTQALRPGARTAARYEHRVKSPTGLQSPFPDNNDLPSCGSPSARGCPCCFHTSGSRAILCSQLRERSVSGPRHPPSGRQSHQPGRGLAPELGWRGLGPGVCSATGKGAGLGGLKDGEPRPGPSWGTVGRVPTHGIPREGWACPRPSWLSRTALRCGGVSQASGQASLPGSPACPAPGKARCRTAYQRPRPPTHFSQKGLRLPSGSVDQDVARPTLRTTRGHFPEIVTSLGPPHLSHTR